MKNLEEAVELYIEEMPENVEREEEIIKSKTTFSIHG